MNGYIYIYNEDGLEHINVRGLWPDQRQLSAFRCLEEGREVPCYTDDDQWDIPSDIINTLMQDLLKNEVKLLLAPEKGEVTVDEEAKE